MSGMDINSIKNILEKYGTRPSKGLGQNFLIDQSALNKIIQTAEIRPNDTILEIGPGLGVLTKELAKGAGKVIAVEKDLKMIEILKETLKDSKNVEIIQGDVLKIVNCKLIAGRHADSAERCNCKLKSNLSGSPPAGVQKNYKVVANLPYYITSPTIRKFLEMENKPELMVLIIQKEVAQRICASSPRMNLLAVSVQFYAEPKIISYISKNSFWPSPKVDGAILKISAFIQRKNSAFNQRFFRIVKAGFSHPRKQLVNNLSTLYRACSGAGVALTLPNGVKLEKEQIKNWLSKNKINPSQRAETLSIEDWINLIKTFKGFCH